MAQNPAPSASLSTLTFNSLSTYKVDLNSSTATADKVVGKGVTINSAAIFFFPALGSPTLATGTVFTVISNTAATPSAGTSGSLPTARPSPGNNFQVSYQGGDGNPHLDGRAVIVVGVGIPAAKGAFIHGAGITDPGCRLCFQVRLLLSRSLRP